MSPHDQLTLQGTFLEHPFAELLTEIAEARLDGSMRVSDKEKKCVYYFKKGRIALAVSNVRTMRIFEMLLERRRLTKEELAQATGIANDFELADALVKAGLLTPTERTELFIDQIEAILIDTVSWQQGDWIFNSLARLKDGLVFDIKVEPLLVNYARCIPTQMVLARFRSDSETFVRSETADLSVVRTPEEAAILKIVGERPWSIREIVAASGVGHKAAIHALYGLWLAGILVRGEWNPAFPQHVVDKMNNAKLELKQEALFKAPAAPKIAKTAAHAANVTTVSAPPPKAPEPKLTLEEYLAQVEDAETYYDALGVDIEADSASIKRAYFNLARSFHPDHYHQEGAATLNRVQSAFTELARAHETLKDSVLRETYNFKIRKELEGKRKNGKASTPDERGRQLAAALENFERGFSLLMDNDGEASLPFLARAVHYDPNNARFHAYFGKALSTDESKRHQAESEMQTALRLDPQNATYRIMLAEFFVQFKLFKRAEGELNRLLAVFPSNREARDLLNRIRNS